MSKDTSRDDLGNIFKGVMGEETRDQILPSKTFENSEFVLPSYDFADAIPRPAQIGVRRGGSFGDVLDAAKGVAYYTDVIGFGQSSTPLTSGMPFSPLGINFFMPSGIRCSNGANMWTYVEGIPRGDALGATIQKAMNEMNLPKLKGLAPGMVEDAKQALNPKPLFQAAFGNVYPVCKKEAKPVGDARGNLKNPEPGSTEVWIDPKTVIYKNGIPHQERWVQATDAKGDGIFLSQAEWEATEKTMNPDGTPIQKKSKEGFEDGKKASLVVAIVLLCGAVALTCRKK